MESIITFLKIKLN